MLQQTEVTKSVYTAFRDSPFALQESVKEIYVKAGSSIQEIIDQSVTEEWQKKYLRVVLNDEVIKSDDYALTFVKETDVVGMVLVPQDGDVGQIFKAIAIIAIVVIATYFAGPAGAGLSAPLAAGVGAAAGLAASLALNALFPPPVPTLSSASSGVTEDPVYGFSRTGNQINKYGTIPRIYGCRKVFPQHAIAPYIIAQGTDQYLYQAFTVGYGPIKIEQLMIGENAIGNYSDVEYYVHEEFEAGDELKIVKEDNWQDPYSITLLKDEEHIIATTDDANKASLAIQFPAGLYYAQPNGSKTGWDIDIEVQIRQIGSSTWSNLTSFSPVVTDGTIKSTVTANQWNQVGSSYTSEPNYAVINELPESSSVGNGEYRTLATSVNDEYGNAIYSYQDYQNSYVVASSTSTVNVSRSSSRPFFTNVNVTFPTAGKWEFKIKRLSDDHEALPGPVANCSISSLRSIKDTPPVASDKPIGLIELKIKATDQLNGAVNNLSCVVKSILPVWNGSSWSNQETRNPAWAYLDIMRGSAAKTPISDSRIDLTSFKAWADWCNETQPNFAFTPPTNPDVNTTTGFVTNLYYTILYRVPDADGLAYWIDAIDTAKMTRAQVQSFFLQSAEAADIKRACCDIEITSQTTAWEALKLVAATGYATPSQNGGQYSITVDKQKDTPIQMFTPKNIKSFSGNMSYHIQPHALRISYTKTNETDTDEIIVYDDGYNADGSGGKTQATIFETMKLVGITRYNQAYTVGRRALAQGKLRIEKFTISCDVENLLATRGSLVRLAHDVPKIGAGTGRVTHVSGSTITIDEDFKLTTGTIYAIVRKLDGSQSNRLLAGVSGRTATINGATLSEGDLIVYGELNRVVTDCLVKSVRPSNDLTATLELVPYAPGIYTAEIDTIPERDVFGSTWTGGNTGGGGGTNTGTQVTPGLVTALAGSMQIAYEGGTQRVTVNLAWAPPTTGGRAVSYKIWYLDGTTWQLLGDTTALEYTAFNQYTFTDANGNVVDFSNKQLTFAVSAVGEDGYSIPPDNAAQVIVNTTISPPQTITSLNAYGRLFVNELSWTYGDNVLDIALVEIWGAKSTNDRSQAILIAKIPSTNTRYNHTGLEDFATWYYWIRVSDSKNVYSDWFPASATGGVECSPGQSPEALIYLLDGALSENAFVAELNERIDLIDTIGPPDLPDGLIAKVRTHDGDINTLYADTDTIANNLLDAAVLIDKHETMITGAGIYIDEGTGSVHIYGVDNLQGQLNLVEADLDAANAQISLRATQAYVDQKIVEAVIDPSQIAELDDLYARVSTVEIDLDAAETAIGLKASITTVDGIDARLGTAEIDIDALEGAIVTKVSNTEFDGLGSRVTTVEEELSAIGDGASIVRTVEDVRYIFKEQDKAAESVLRNLFTEERNFNLTQGAIANATETLRAYTDGKTLAEAEARLELAAALAAADAELAASVYEEQVARVTADEAEAISRLELAAQIESDIADVNASIVDEAAIRLAADEAEAVQRLALQATVETNLSTTNAAILSEATARANADSAEASARETLRADLERDISTVSASVATETSARVTADSALSSQITTLTSSVDSNAAAIQSEATTRANADSALATSISTVQTTVNGHTTSIETNTTSISGIEGKYSVKIDNNGYVSGFGLISTANTATPFSEFIFVADKFSFAPVATNPNAADGSPFYVLTSPQVINGVTVPAGTYMKKAFISDATVDTLKIAGNSVTVPSSFQLNGEVPNIGNVLTTIVSGTIVTSGFQPIVITSSSGIGGASNNGPENFNSIAVDCEVYAYVQTLGGATVAFKRINQGLTIDPGVMRLSAGSCMFTAAEIPAGTYNFSIRAKVTQTVDGTNVKGLLARFPSFTVLETKR